MCPRGAPGEEGGGGGGGGGEGGEKEGAGPEEGDHCSDPHQHGRQRQCQEW